MSRLNPFLFWVVVSGLGCASQVPLATRVPLAPRVDIFDGYEPLLAPRDTLPIGSRWTSFGPTDEGLPGSALSSTKSFNEFRVTRRGTSTSSFGASLFSLVEGRLGRSGASLDSIVLKGVQLVAVRRPGDLRLRPDEQYLWEGLKVSSLDLYCNTFDTLSVRATLDSLSPRARVSFRTLRDRSASQMIYVSNLNAFIAARFIRASEMVRDTLVSREVASFVPRVELSTNYSVRATRSRPCSLSLNVRCNSRNREGTLQPETLVWDADCHQWSEASIDGEYPIDELISVSGLERQWLVVDNSKVNGESMGTTIAGDFRIVRERLSLRAAPAPTSAGWFRPR